MKAVMMAGGEGSRLRPLTYSIPKPLLPVGKKPIAQIILEQLKKYGFEEITMVVEYKADLIQAYFRDGKALGVRINYVAEKFKMGTAGGLSLLKDELKDDFLLVYSDILTNLDFEQFFKKHQENQAALTVVVKQHKLTVPFGVVEIEAGKIRGVKEKPSLDFTINAGIYGCSPAILSYIPANQTFDMTDLITCLAKEKQAVAVYEFNGIWHDIAQEEDLIKATREIQNWT